MSGAWDSVKPWIAKIAPMVGTALGGPLGGVAGALLSNALGIKDASPDSIKAAIQNGTLTGEQIVALKQAEESFTLQMAQLNIKSVQDLQALEYQDRDSARKREEAVKDPTPEILAYLVTLGFFGILAWVLWKGFPEANETAKAIVTMLIGALGHAWSQNVMGYFFGGSSDANKQIDKLSGGQQ
jgi:hypothetical protein